MIKKHEINTVIGHPALSDLEYYLSEAMSVCNQLVALLTAVNEFYEDQDDDALLDEIDTAAVMQYNGIHIFYDCRLSTCSAINKYLGKTLVLMDKLHEMLEKFSLTSMTPVDDDGEDGLKCFKAVIQRCIAGLTHFMCYEFDLFSYVDDFTNGNEKPDIDEVYHGVTAKSNNIDAKTKAIELCSLALKFKQKLEIFDEFPDKEAPFEKIMGPFAAELNEENLTVDLVDKVIDGVLSPQELLDITNPEDVDGDSGTAEMSIF